MSRINEVYRKLVTVYVELIRGAEENDTVIVLFVICEMVVLSQGIEWLLDVTGP